MAKVNMMLRKSVACLILSLSAASSCVAAEIRLDEGTRVSLRGFGTSGATASTIDSGSPALVRDQQDDTGIQKGEPAYAADSRLGLQLDALFDPRFSAAAQVVFKDRPEQNFNNDLQWAFLKYQHDPLLQLRVGRMGVDSFLLSDQRNVGFTYLWVRPPIEFYGPFAVYSYDGADARYSMPLGAGVLDAKVFYGRSSPTIPYSQSNHFTMDFHRFWGGNLVFGDDVWRARVGYVSTIMGNNFVGLDQLQSSLDAAMESGYADASRLSDSLVTQDKRVQFISAGFSYDRDNWQAQGEVAKTIMETHFFPSIYNAYLSLARQIGVWTPYASFSRVLPASDVIQAAPAPDPALQPLVDAVDTTFNSTSDNQETFSLGTRWDFRNNMDLKLQYDRTRVRDGGYGLWQGNGQTPQPNAGYDILSLTLDFVF